jgi:tRNA (guanine6-N2)-methyltransferase
VPLFDSNYKGNDNALYTFKGVSMADVFAITTRGLEQVSAQEMSALTETTVKSIGYRRIEVDAGNIAALSSLRTVDDVFLKLETWSNVGHQRAELQRFTSLSAALDLESQLSFIKPLRSISRSPLFSVTANFVGKRNYSAPEIKESVADGVLGHYDSWRYSEDDDTADINLRIFIEHDEALVGMRLFKHPLHRRPYKLDHLPGSLKPPVAAALAQLANVTARMHVLDPFCGAGTILIEAALMDSVAMGGDVNPKALTVAQGNARNAEVNVLLEQWDATNLPLSASSVDCVISNLPWGKQIVVDDNLKTLYQRALAEMRRVVKPAGQIVLLTANPELFDETFSDQTEISLYGQNPKIVRLINQK